MKTLTWEDFRAHYDAMTLGDATTALANQGWACACVGGPPGAPGGACFCRLSWAQIERLHRAAHIVVKLVDAAARKPAAGPREEQP